MGTLSLPLAHLADNIVTYLCDVSDYEQVEATATKVREEVS